VAKKATFIWLKKWLRKCRWLKKLEINNSNDRKKVNKKQYPLCLGKI
jgi:hypothetical protein